jgi:hypothetical protein
MSDMKNPQDDAAAPTATVVAILVAAAVASVMLMFGSVTDLGSVDANAASAVLPASDQVFTPEEHSAFIREGHSRAVLGGDDSPLPPAF